MSQNIDKILSNNPSPKSIIKTLELNTRINKICEIIYR